MLRTGKINGHLALWLENEALSVAVLPRKGADIYAFIHRPSGVDCLMKTPGGLKPPGDEPRDFLENYEGGWQELFPNPGDAVVLGGADLPFHGEVALLPWDYSVERDDADEIAVRFQVNCRRVPVRLERLMRLRQNQPILEIEGRVVNLSPAPQAFLWGHHVVLGRGFLEAGCRMEAPVTTIVTPEELAEPATAALAPGQTEPWPMALGRQPGERIDLREIPGPEAHWHDDIYLTGLTSGKVDIVNPRLRLRFRLDWDPAVFGCLVNWRPLGGADLPPLTGIYGLGIEPWVSRLNLTAAIAQREALQVAPFGVFSTKLSAAIEAG